MFRAEDPPRAARETKGGLLSALRILAKRVGHVFHAGRLVRRAENATARRGHPERGTSPATFRLAPVVLGLHICSRLRKKIRVLLEKHTKFHPVTLVLNASILVYYFLSFLVFHLSPDGIS